VNESLHPKVVWKAESTHPLLIEPFRQALRQVVDPEIGMSVIELGLIRDLVIEDGLATVTMIMTTPFCPYIPALLEMTRKKAEEALGMPTKVALGMDAWDFSMMEEGAGADWGLY
jgi:metal-sulfur cluster biosynthetic enzyme